MSNNQRRYILGALSLVATFLVLSFFIRDISFLGSDSASALNTLDLKDWSLILHLSSNAYFPWKLDPIWTRFGLSLSTVDYSLLHYSIFATGLYCLLVFKGGRSISSFFLSIGAFLSIVLIFGLNVAIAGMIAWLPAVTLSVYLFCWQTRQAVLTGLLLAFFALRLSSSGLYLSLIPAVIAFYLGAPFKFVTIERLVLGAGILFTPVIYTLLSIPSLEFPDYPIGRGSLVPDDGLPGHTQSLFGPSWPIQVTDFSSFGESLLPLLILLALLGIYLARKYSITEPIRITYFVSIILVLLQITLPMDLAAIAPLSALSRILPGHFLVPLPILLAAITFTLLPILLVEGKVSAIEKLIISLLVPVALLAWQGKNLHLPLTETGNHLGGLSFLSSENAAEYRSKILSPSYFLVNRESGSALNSAWLNAPRRSISPLRWGGAITTSIQQGNASLMVDKDKKTLWGTKLTNQIGNEWIHVKLDSAQEFEGISLNLGKNTSDWPRGLEISASESCENLPKNTSWSDYHTIYKASPWLGPVLHSKKGYPFYGSRSVAKVIFPQPIKAKCILIKQTGSSNNAPWSVAELRFLIPQR